MPTFPEFYNERSSAVHSGEEEFRKFMNDSILRWNCESYVSQ